MHVGAHLLCRNLAAHAVEWPPRKWKCQQPSTRCCYSMLLSWATAQAHGWALSYSSSMTWQLDHSSMLQPHCVIVFFFPDWIWLSFISKIYGSHRRLRKVRNVANFGRLQEECDVMSLVLAPCPRPTKSPEGTEIFKPFLASLSVIGWWEIVTTHSPLLLESSSNEIQKRSTATRLNTKEGSTYLSSKLLLWHPCAPFCQQTGTLSMRLKDSWGTYGNMLSKR